MVLFLGLITDRQLDPQYGGKKNNSLMSQQLPPKTSERGSELLPWVEQVKDVFDSEESKHHHAKDKLTFNLFMIYFENMTEVLNCLFHISTQADPHLWGIHTNANIFNKKWCVHFLQLSHPSTVVTFL